MVTDPVAAKSGFSKYEKGRKAKALNSQFTKVLRENYHLPQNQVYDKTSVHFGQTLVSKLCPSNFFILETKISTSDAVDKYCRFCAADITVSGSFVSDQKSRA